MIRLLVSTAALVLLAACATEAGQRVQDFFRPASKGQAALTLGLNQYESGDYADSAKNLQAAIGKGLSNRERVDAHKHLAFINCASSRERQCRDEFRKALAIDPALELEASEAGHPIWGPIFRSLKAGR